ncbi:MAG: metallophosphoesterase [Hyphomicrobiaceae bacterium]|nr:metallophosphoesterase [Hyphomicrobiaceae bacterium]
MVRPAPLRLAHVSDVHLPRVAALPPHLWNAKRILGKLNWQTARRHDHDPAVLARIVADLAAHRPDHIAVTGDLVNLGLPDEYEAARAWLAELGPPDRVSVVPGNHDIYVPLPAAVGIGRWADHYTSGPAGPSGGALATSAAKPPPFPFVRRFAGGYGRIALVGVNSAIPTPVFVAAGRLGDEQLRALEAELRALAADGYLRVLLIHHPPLPGQAAHRRALADAVPLQAMLARAGAELVLHGHNHRNSVVWTAGPAGPIPVVGVASASSARTRHGHADLARYNLIELSRPGDSPVIDLVGRGLLTPSGEVVEVERTRLAGPVT